MDYGLKQKDIRIAWHKALQKGKIFYILPAVYLVVLLLNKGFVHPSGYYRLHYLFTYDHGIVSRGLVGEVMSWFFDTVTDRTIQYVVFGCSAVMIIGAVLCFGRALNKVKDNPEHLVYSGVLVMILLVMPTSFGMQFESITLDKFIWTLTIFAVFLSGFKYSVWLVPMLCVLSSFVNPVYVFSSMFLIALVLLQRFYSEGFSLKLGTVCFLSYAGIIIATLISVGSTSTTGFADTNEMLDFYYQRFIGEPITDHERELFAEEWLFEYFVSAQEIFRRTFDYYFKEWGFGITVVIYSAVIVLPITTLLTIIWIKAIKASERKFQKLIYIFCMIAPAVIIPETILGWEIPRYFSDSLIVQLSLLLFFVVNSNEGVIAAIRKVADYLKNHLILTVMLILHLALIIVL